VEKILGFDLGTTTLGVSYHNELGIVTGIENFAYPAMAYIRPRKEANRLIKEYEVKKVVIGLPLNMDDTESNMTKACRIFASRLKEDNPDVEVILENERCSTFEAYELMKNANIKKEKQKELVDMYAAIVILNQYINRSK